MAKKSGQPMRHNQETRAKPEMDKQKLAATRANAKIIATGLGFHDPRFAPTNKSSGGRKK